MAKKHNIGEKTPSLTIRLTEVVGSEVTGHSIDTLRFPIQPIQYIQG